MTCFLVKAWGYHFNPNLKFIKSSSFQKKILLALLIMATIDLFYNIPNLTAAIEPGILEETERYLLIVIFLAGLIDSQSIASLLQSMVQQFCSALVI